MNLQTVIMFRKFIFSPMVYQTSHCIFAGFSESYSYFGGLKSQCAFDLQFSDDTKFWTFFFLFIDHFHFFWALAQFIVHLLIDLFVVLTCGLLDFFKFFWLLIPCQMKSEQTFFSHFICDFFTLVIVSIVLQKIVRLLIKCCPIC